MGRAGDTGHSSTSQPPLSSDYFWTRAGRSNGAKRPQTLPDHVQEPQSHMLFNQLEMRNNPFAPRRTLIWVANQRLGKARGLARIRVGETSTPKPSIYHTLPPDHANVVPAGGCELSGAVLGRFWGILHKGPRI